MFFLDYKTVSTFCRFLLAMSIFCTRSCGTPISPVWPLRLLQSCQHRKLTEFIKTAKSGANFCSMFFTILTSCQYLISFRICISTKNLLPQICTTIGISSDPRMNLLPEVSFFLHFNHILCFPDFQLHFLKFLKHKSCIL